MFSVVQIRENIFFFENKCLFKYGKTLQIPAFFENLIPRPVGSFSSSGSSTLKRILFLIRFSVNPVFQSSILNFSCSKTAFFIHAYSRATFNRAEKINSRAIQNCSKSVPMGILWWHLRRFLVTTFPAMLRFFNSRAAYN